MKTRTALTAAFASVVAAVIGWQIGAVAIGGGSTDSASRTSAQPADKLTDGTYTGTNEQTRFGDVQVEIIVSSGKISDAKTVVLTGNEGRSEQINNQAAPILRSEVLSAQSAKVDTVSGATYTSDAYLSSLQAALDEAAA